MAALGATAAAREAAHGPAEPQPPHHSERHFVDFAHWCAVARPAGVLRPGRDGVEPVLPLARGGIWDRVLAALQSQAEARNEVEWSLLFVDATIVRAHQHAAGARRPFDKLRRRRRGVRAKRWGARKGVSQPNCTCAPR